MPIVLWVCASSWELVYFATEFKQYSSDLLTTLLLLLMGDDLSRHDLKGRRILLAIFGGMAAVWCSIPLDFRARGDRDFARDRCDDVAPMAAIRRPVRDRLRVGMQLRRELRRVPEPARQERFHVDVVGLRLPAAAAALAGRHRERVLELRQRVHRPRADWIARSSPRERPSTDWIARSSPWKRPLLAVGLFAIGVASLGSKKNRFAVMTLLVPIVLAMMASALRRFPFHGRLLVYLVPMFVLPMAEGISVIGRYLGRALMVLVALALILPPTVRGPERDGSPPAEGI